mgnify:CR=1 FL=1
MNGKKYRYVGKEMSNEMAYAKATGKAKYGVCLQVQWQEAES